METMVKTGKRERKNRHRNNRFLRGHRLRASVFFAALLTILASTTAVANTTLTLHPSGAASGDEMKSYSGGSAATALDTNDGDTSYGELDKDELDEARLELDDHTTETGTIVSVQIKAVMKDDTGSSDDTTRLGPKTNGVEYWGSEISNVPTSYTLYSGSLYTTNPNTEAAWTWSEIDSLVALVDNLEDGTADYFITELYAEVIYNVAPTLTIDEPNGTGDSVTVGDNYSIQYDLADPDDVTTVAFYYDTNNTGLDGTAITGACATAAEGTNATCTWDTTGVAAGTYYVYGKTNDGTNPEVTGYSPGQIAIFADNSPIGGYTADNVIPAAQISQATSGTGVLTINWKGRDLQSDNVTLKTFEYSVDGGATWNAPTNGDASASLSTNWDDNGGSNWSTATTFGAATAHSFTFNTQHADVSGLAGVDQSDVQIRFKLNDGTNDSASYATSENVRVDNALPTATITSAAYAPSSDTLTMTGTNFTTIAAASTDIKSDVDWTRFVWDINGDNATTANITVVVGDVTSLTVTNATTLTLVFTGAKGTAIEGTTGYGVPGGNDTIDVTAGFSKDVFGNAATTDGAADAALSVGTVIITISKLSAVISDPMNGTTNPLRIPGSVIEYSISPSNTGDGSPDTNSVFTIDDIDTATIEYDATTGVGFTDGTTASGLALGAVSYSNDASPGPYTYNYTPVPDGDGYDSSVTSIKVTTTGIFNHGGSPAPSFTLKFRVRVK
ncbi:MAG: hypothetical protein ACE5GK_02195 [Nitrospiria bacterium]